MSRELIQLINTELDTHFAESSLQESILNSLAAYINDLIINDFEKLVYYLYRIDVSEHKLKAILQATPQQDAGVIIATMIIERQSQKIESRKKYHKPPASADAPDEEKWP